MDALLAGLVVLLVMAGASGYYITRPSYWGTGNGLGPALYAIAALLVVAIILRLLSIF